MDPKMLEIFGTAAENPAADEVLQGTFDVEGKVPDSYLRTLLNYMKMPTEVLQKGMLEDLLTLSEHIKGWRKQKERTLSVELQLSFTDNIAATYHDQMVDVDRLIRQIPY